ncbi:MAG: hypothetical protein IT320_09625 [Anaerolineae bacterium]|nr:hypothetical protein [Anaerolineae bacterium]
MHDDQTHEFSVDPEHTGLRLAVIAGFFGLAVLAFLIFSALLPGSWTVINIILAAVVAYGGAMLIERWLKGHWHSGRAVHVNPAAARMTQKGAVETQIDAASPVEVLTWRFEVKGRGRVPKGWWVVACSLAQDDRLLAVYTFMSPKNLEALSNTMLERFKVLTSEKKNKRTGDSVGVDMRLAGEQRRLHAAEQRRWQEGAEMNNDDFVRYVEYVVNTFTL